MRHMSHFRKFAGPLFAALLAVASPALAHDEPAETANKQVVLDFYQALNDSDATGTRKERIQGIIERYLSPEYVQHAEAFADLPGPGSPRDRLIRLFQTMPEGPPMPPARTLAVMAEGDLVMMLTARDMPDPATGGTKPAYVFNMFRVRNGQLVEHWDLGTSAPPGAPGGPPPGAPPSGPATPPENQQ